MRRRETAIVHLTVIAVLVISTDGDVAVPIVNILVFPARFGRHARRLVDHRENMYVFDCNCPWLTSLTPCSGKSNDSAGPIRVGAFAQSIAVSIT